jgi:hypothetical protein
MLIYSCGRNTQIMYQRSAGEYKGRTDKLRSVSRIDFDPVSHSLFSRLWRWLWSEPVTAGATR